MFNVTDDPLFSTNSSLYTNTSTPVYLNSSDMAYTVYNSSVSSSVIRNEQLNAFFYIVAVLLFYSVSIVMLMIKYIKREEQECELDFYYLEFVKREHISSFAIDPRTSHVTLSLEMFNEKEKEAAKCNHGDQCNQGDQCHHGAKCHHGEACGYNHGAKCEGNDGNPIICGARSGGGHPGNELLLGGFETSV